MKLRMAMLLAALSGFVALSYEILWYRVIAFMTRSVASSFGLLLGAYLGGLALGSGLFARYCKDRTRAGEVRTLYALGGFVALANVVAALVVPVFGWSATFTDYRVGLAMVALGASLLGSVLPLVSHFGIEPDDVAGARLSYVYLANIVGSAAGSLLTGFVLMNLWPIATVAVFLAVAGFVVAASPLWVAGGRGRRVGVAALALLSLLALWAVPRGHDRLYERLLYKWEWAGQRFARVIENRSGVICVTDDGTVYGGGAYDGVVSTSIRRDKNGIVRAYAIGALHPRPRSVLMVGLSSGSWAQVVAHLPGVEELTVVEINPGYASLVAEHREVAGLLQNPKVHLYFDDGRRWLLKNPDRRFDFVVMNTTWHWRAHITNLLSVEYMRLVRARLSPGGVFYFNTTWSEDAMKTAATEFPHALRVNNFVAVSDAPFGFDRERWKSVLASLTIEGQPALDPNSSEDRRIRDDLAGWSDLESRESLLLRTSGARVVTDDNMVVEWREPLRYPKPE